MKPDKNNINREGFEIPQDYFAELEAKLISRTDGSSTVPEHYFDGLEEKIMESVKPQETKLFSMRRMLSLAAMFVLLIGGYQLFQKENTTSDLTFEEEYAYIDLLMEDVEGVDEEMLMDLLDFDESNVLDEDDLMEFLEDESMDWDILEELI